VRRQGEFPQSLLLGWREDRSVSTFQAMALS
jgi:hypothetical protein